MTTLTTTPRADDYHMPAEWAPHSQTWMVWPQRPDNWRDQGTPAQAAFTAVAKAIARFEPVTVCVTAEQYVTAREQLDDPRIRLVEISSDDAWVRDTGPTFVINGKGGLRGVDWTFNAWGGLEGGLYEDWQRDDEVARKILEIERCERYRVEGFVLEGGSIHVDGEGTLITTEECLLNRNRNPHLSREKIEAVLADYLAIDKVIWLPHGLYNDETDGHVDNFCCFVRPGEVLLAWTDDRDNPNYERCQAAMRVLEQARDAWDRPLTVHKMPIPGPLHATEQECAGIVPLVGTQPRDPSIRLAGSYVNFLIVNGGIIAPSFGDPLDKEAKTILARLFPDHEVVMVPGREILLGGGNIHCITQQQPLPAQRRQGANQPRPSTVKPRGLSQPVQPS